MNVLAGESLLEGAKGKLSQLLSRHELLDENLLVKVGLLTPEEAIGSPLRRDFPILLGKERVIEARFKSARGHAFTDAPIEFRGPVREILDRRLESNADRALFVATLNAVLRHLGQARGTVHCRDDEPEKCAVEIARLVRGKQNVGLIGCNPAILDALAKEFGPERVILTDLNPENIGQTKYGVEVWHGETRMEDLVHEADMVVLTGTTFVNDTFPRIWESIARHGKDYLIYGVTASGLCQLSGLNRVCPYGRDH